MREATDRAAIRRGWVQPIKPLIPRRFPGRFREFGWFYRNRFHLPRSPLGEQQLPRDFSALFRYRQLFRESGEGSEAARCARFCVDCCTASASFSSRFSKGLPVLAKERILSSCLSQGVLVGSHAGWNVCGQLLELLLHGYA